MPTKNLEAIILSRKNFGEADRLLTAFSKSEGKVKILAKGARKLKSKMASHIEPFCVGKYFVAEGKSFYILAGAESIYSNYKSTGNIDIFKRSSYVCELLELTSVEKQNDENIFEIAKETLRILPTLNNEKQEFLLRYFEFNILKSCGYTPDFKDCKKCHKPLIEQESYSGDFEGLYCSACNKRVQIEKETVKVLRLFCEKDLKYLLRIHDIEKFNRGLSAVISTYLYDILPRNPKSNSL